MAKNVQKKTTDTIKTIFEEIQEVCRAHRLHSTVLLVTLLMTIYEFSYYKHSSCMGKSAMIFFSSFS